VSSVSETGSGEEFRCWESRLSETGIRTLSRRIASYLTGASRPKHQYAPEIRPNADSTIDLLTLGTASFLHFANRTTLERMGLAASRRLESWMQSLEMT
jgi:hypothetical protein